jgi:hypothetical protein
VPADFALLSDALAAAVAGDTILVSGDIIETTKIRGKTGVDVRGLAGASVTVADIPDLEGFRFVNVTDAEWRDLTLRRTGTAVKAQLTIVTGASDVRFEHCQLVNLARGESHSIGVWIGVNAEPVFRNCNIFGGTGGPYCCGVDCNGESQATFIDCEIYGGNGGGRCYGLHAANSAGPVALDSYMWGGNGGENCDGVRLEGSGQPVLVRCMAWGKDGYNSHGITVAAETRAVLVDCDAYGGPSNHSHGIANTGDAAATIVDSRATSGTGARNCQGLLAEVDSRPVLVRVTAAVGAEGDNNNSLGLIHDCQMVAVELKTVNKIVES